MKHQQPSALERRDISLREAEEILRKGDLADPKRLQQKVNEAEKLEQERLTK